MRLGFDLDGVLADGIREIWEGAKRRGYVPEDHTFECVQKNIDEQYGIPCDVVKEILCCDLYESCPPITEAIEDVKRWRDEGHYIVFITARSEEFTPGVIDATEGWMEQYDLLEGTAGVIYAPMKKKHLIAAELYLDVFVDDSDDAIRPMIGIVDQPFLIRTSYNIEANDLRRWEWSDVAQEIDGLIARQVDSMDRSEVVRADQGI